MMASTIPRTTYLAISLSLFSGVMPSHGNAEERIEGFTGPYRQIELAFGESGVLAELRVKEGARVQEGEVLAQLDTTVLERTLDIARQRSESNGALSAAQAELELRTKYWQQLSQLHDRGHATQREIDRASTDVKVAEARVAMAEEEQSLQRLECRRIEAQIERRILRSPLNGVVSEVLRETGESFLANDPRVLTVVQLDRLLARFSVPPELAATLTLDQSVPLMIGSDSRPLDGTVESIAPVMDAKSGTVDVTVAVDNPHEAIASGVRCWLLVRKTTHEEPLPTRYTSATRSENP